MLAFGDEIDLLEHGWGKSDEDFLGHGHLLGRKNKRSETRTQEDNVFFMRSETFTVLNKD